MLHRDTHVQAAQLARRSPQKSSTGTDKDRQPQGSHHPLNGP